MISSFRHVLPSLAAIALLAPPVVAQVPRPMSEAEMRAAGGQQIPGPAIRQRYLGNTVYVLFLKGMGGVAAGSIVPIYHGDERNRTVKLATGQKLPSHWWIDGNTYCNEQRLVNAGNQCYTMWDLAGTGYSCLQPEGDCLLSGRIVPGNPENL